MGIVPVFARSAGIGGASPTQLRSKFVLFEQLSDRNAWGPTDTKQNQTGKERAVPFFLVTRLLSHVLKEKPSCSTPCKPKRQQISSYSKGEACG